MKLVKDRYREFWVNNKDEWHGEYKAWWFNGQLKEQCFWVNNKMHGEGKWWESDGELKCHEYWSHGKIVRDLLEEPVTEEDKFMLLLQHGGQWLCI